MRSEGYGSRPARKLGSVLLHEGGGKGEKEGGKGRGSKCKLRREIRIHKYTEVKKQLAK